MKYSFILPITVNFQKFDIGWRSFEIQTSRIRNRLEKCKIVIENKIPRNCTIPYFAFEKES